MQQKADKKTGMGLLIAAKIVLKQGKTGGSDAGRPQCVERTRTSWHDPCSAISLSEITDANHPFAVFVDSCLLRRLLWLDVLGDAADVRTQEANAPLGSYAALTNSVIERKPSGLVGGLSFRTVRARVPGLRCHRYRAQ